MLKRQYSAILADPPWQFKNYSDETATHWVGGHYDLLSLDNLKALPIKSLASDDCILFLWATFPLLPQAFEVISAWGFQYKTVAFVWAKLNKNTMGFFMGMGYWTRSNAEICLLATIGHPKRINADIPQLIVAPRQEHSRKPDEQYERIEGLVAGNYLELFARRKREGWDVWGNEIQSDITLE